MHVPKISELKKRIIDRNKIRRIRESEYFDEDYYLNENLDVRDSGMDAASHFYYYGWKEKRNPKQNFNTERFLSKYPKVLFSKKNLIAYILDNNLKDEPESCLKDKPEDKVPVSRLMDDYFRESIPLKTLNVNREDPRINVIYNGFNKGCFFGGKATALILSIKFAIKYKYKLRIISQNPEREIFQEFLKLFNIDFNGEVEFYSTESSKYLEVSENDHFLCTMWSNADSVLNTKAIQGKIFYIMQEVETFFYDHGDYHLRCFNTLTSDSLIPIVNTKLLYDYLCKHSYENVNKNGIFFEPAFLRKLFAPSKDSFRNKRKYKLFFYARPSHQRNLFYFGLNVLNSAFLNGILDTKEWEVYFAGDDTVPDFKFDSDVRVKNLGLMNWEEYCDFTSRVDLCYSMIYTPHPSYPPLDFATAGAVVVTNKYENKGALHMYSKNIISGKLNEHDMLMKLKQGAKLAKDGASRKKNWEASNINNSWDSAFKEVLPFMEAKIRENTDV